MTTEIIQRMQNQLDAVVQVIPDERVEFWFARDLQAPLGYARRENFMTVIRRAIESCETMAYTPNDHFRGVTKMVRLGSGEEQAADLHARQSMATL